jgi:DNA-binding response OmpR family regulator
MVERLLRKLHILVVEDDLEIQQTLKELLTLYGHTLIVVTDGEKGLAELKSTPFDLMITDLGLPGMSGWDLAKASERYQTLMPIVAISSWQGNEAVEKIAKYGIDIMIWKPFRFDQILDAIDRLCPSPARPIADR